MKLLLLLLLLLLLFLLLLLLLLLLLFLLLLWRHFGRNLCKGRWAFFRRRWKHQHGS
jgi:hypothetical protein